MPRYGLTWDEGLGNLFFGERYLHYFTSLNPKYLDFNTDLKSLDNYPLHLYLSPFHNRPGDFPPLANTLSAASMYLFSYFLKWLNPIDGFHLLTVLFAAAFLWVLYQFAEPRLGKLAAFVAILFLGTYPRFWADMHFNVKDVPETIFFGLVLMAYWTWYEKPSLRKAVSAGILMGCALAIKANAIFVIPILLIAVLPLSLRLEAIKSSFVHFKRYAWHYILMAASTISVYILSWPYLYTDTVARLKNYWAYMFAQGVNGESYSWNIGPLREVLTSMPELMLLMWVIGIVFLLQQVWKNQSPFWRLLLAWVTIPILRVSLPGAVNFDGIRHFLEFLPAAALIAGYGVSRLVNIFATNRMIPRTAMQTGMLILFAVNTAQINIRYYPYLHIYYNTFVGGLSGARDKFLGSEASDYWAASYRQGMEWVNQNAPPNSSVYALVAPWIVDISGPVLLRPDIKVASPLPDFSIMSQSQDPYYLMFIRRSAGDAQDEIDYVTQHSKPVYQLVVDKVTILEIYRFGRN